MTITPKRKSGPEPLASLSELIAAFHAFMLTHPKGLSWTNLVLGFGQPLPETARALARALDAGLVRVSPTDDALSYFAAEHLVLTDGALCAEAVLNFIVAHEDMGRGSKNVTLALDRVITGLARFYSPAELLAGIDVLRQEAVVWFRVLTADADKGILTLTLANPQYFTVVAHDDDAHQPLCFHVRAGNKEIALHKVRDSAYGLPKLSILGITAGWVDFEPVQGHSSMLVENL